MPRGNGTGPNGFGPMTGRGMGSCAGFASPGYMNAGWNEGGYARSRGMGYGCRFDQGLNRCFGRGLGRGFGRSLERGFTRGWEYGPGYHYTCGNVKRGYVASREDALKEEAGFLRGELEAIQNRLRDLESDLNGAKADDRESGTECGSESGTENGKGNDKENR